MDAASYWVTASLLFLTALLTGLAGRAAVRSIRARSALELPWIGGLGFAAAAMAIESVVYVGDTAPGLLQTYVFLSAAIVGVLSLGAVHVLHRPRVERVYTAYTLAGCVLTGVLSFLLPPAPGMVVQGTISGDPSLPLVILSSLVTFPATAVLLTASALALRRSRSPQTLLLIAGALILGAGGTLYIAAFPAALYYTEFVGIVLLFFGLVSLPRPSASPARSGVPRPSP